MILTGYMTKTVPMINLSKTLLFSLLVIFQFNLPSPLYASQDSTNKKTSIGGDFGTSDGVAPNRDGRTAPVAGR